MEGFDRRKFLKGSSVAAGLAGAITVVPGALPAFAKGAQKSSVAKDRAMRRPLPGDARRVDRVSRSWPTSATPRTARSTCSWVPVTFRSATRT